MRRFLTYSVSIIALSAPTWADDIQANSQVSAATLYPNGATVTRTANFSAESGAHSIIISDLPLNFDASSLRVLGEGDEAFTILSVDHRIDRLPPADDTLSPERQRIQDQIEDIETQIRDLSYDRRGFEAQIAVADARLRFIEQLMTREPQDMVDELENQGTGLESWAQAIDVLAQQTQIALTSRNEAQQSIDTNARQMQDLQEDRNKAYQSLQATQLPAPQRSIATIDVATDQAVTGTLSLEYRVPWAGWEPIYDLRLVQGDEAKLSIERHARVYQQTGENWDDIELTLSTARPSNRVGMPEIRATQANMYRTGPAKSVRGPQQSSIASDKGLSRAQAEMIMEDAPIGETVAAQPLNSMIQIDGQTVSYQIPGRIDITGDSTVRQISIDQRESTVGLLARSTPVYDTNAYLYAAYTNQFAGPILPGTASLFRDGTFVGDFQISLVAAGADTTLPFGALDGIKIERRVLEKEQGDFGIIGTTNRLSERFEISAESLLPYALPITIFDRAPFSENEDLEVTISANPRPSETDVDGKRGVQAWTFELGSGQTRKVAFNYEIQWPGGYDMTTTETYR
ncbi:mucoidy inhibitor MuiA family protein [Parasulfitobacter algicola]|uniref:Mucoidy inhibitor MuiA family protein n=1 Tax=Parasulfitobacter algicola TaxID=2614809 RepID=A0ABX2IML3_9RHOB|nr:mucoidy inhibitor MuiA family protein [Sulfitobacter algicola]NSX53216.1 mucoidy inhibitor MuiA family protein [Sulfitobacter algicola]